ncbi:hypothetical protein G4G27_04855 [Sphingomonas sp. So64.6b]|uniref:hypothetical protein n=1 Tax=Sphingomonas sp. So64.6b TaxID=2997354 RepID=UPI0016027136|nr:hypothetical protein [Sphingomonas sp. So64.6b]QNA83405.1 hypothetical protein G4G27_04855 [Sphingomonas sp. So64.6b]
MPKLITVPGALYIVIIGFVIALAHALFLGLPAFFALRDYWRLHWWSAALGGAVVAVIPMILLNLTPPAYDIFRQGGVTLIIDGTYTRAGRIDLARRVSWQAMIGAVAGFAFWRALRSSPSVSHLN